MGCEFCPYAILDEFDRNAVWCGIVDKEAVI